MALRKVTISKREAKQKKSHFGDGTDVLIGEIYGFEYRGGGSLYNERDYVYQRTLLDMGKDGLNYYDNAAYRRGFVNQRHGNAYDRNERSFYKTIIGSKEGDTIIGVTTIPPHLQFTAPLSPNLYVDDQIYGGEGNDIIYGRDGNDTLFGEIGNDRIYGGNGNDEINGGKGNDRIYGGNGTDTINGGEGNDIIFSGALTNGASDVLEGGAGADTFFLGEPTQDTTQTIQPEPFDWAGLSLDLVSGFTNEVIPGAGTVINGIRTLMEHDWSKAKTVVVPDKNSASYATVKDFSAAEDFLIVPMAAGGNFNVFMSDATTSESDLSLFYDTDTGNNTFATLKFDWATDKKHYGINQDVKDLTTLTESQLETSYKTSMRDTLKKNALIIGKDESGQNKFLVGMENSESLVKEFDQGFQQKLNNGKRSLPDVGCIWWV